MQRVHLGRTQSGKPGLFTGNTVAMPLTEAEAEMPEAELRAYCSRLGFALDVPCKCTAFCYGPQPGEDCMNRVRTNATPKE